jgi:hypothetical protein
MRTLVLLWLGASVGTIGLLTVRYGLRQWQIQRDHAEALREDVARTDALMRKRIRDWRQANQRFLKDLGLKVATPRVQPCVFQTPFGSKCGYNVRAQNDAARAEVIAVAPEFRPARVA